MRLLAHISFWFTSLCFAAAAEKKSSPLLYCVAYAPDLSTVFTKKGGQGHESVTLSNANVIELKDAPLEKGYLTFFGPASQDGKQALVAKADLSNLDQPLIVLNPVIAADRPPYNTTVLEASLDHFPLGSYQLLNLSPHPLRVVHGKESIEIPTGSSKIYAPKGEADVPLSITMEYKLNEEWLIISSSNWSNRNDRRTLVCVIEDASSGRMLTKSIPLR